MREILDFLHIAEKLKKELRHSWLSDGRQESSAEHSWRVALMAIVFHSELKSNIDLAKALKIAIVHDIAEAEAYDIPAQDTHRTNEKARVELAAMEKIRGVLGEEIGNEIFSLWQEYEEQNTLEAKYIKAIDKMEVRLQHNEADIKSWDDIEFPRSLYVADEYCEFDPFLQEFNKLIKVDSIEKIRKSEKNLIEIQTEANLKMKK